MKLSLLSLASKAAMIGAQLVATALVLGYLSPREQGYYYSFIALIAVQGIFELGLSQVLVVFLSHEAPAARRHDLNDYRPGRRARAIASAALRQYVVLMVLFTLSVGVGGSLFFHFMQSIGSSSGDRVTWAVPWWLLVAASGLRLPLIWLEAVIEGIGNIQQVLLARTLAQAAWLAAFFVTLLGGFGLFAPTAAALTLLVTSSLAYWRYRHTIQRLTHRHARQAQRIDWRREVSPMQRRVSGTWIASYLISNTPVPICFALLGAVEAGRAGVAFQVAAAIGVIAGALVSPKISAASRLVAARQFHEYRGLLLRSMRRTLAASTLVAVLGMVVIATLPIVKPQFASRLPSLLETAPLLAAALINSLMSCVAVFSRAQKNELFTIPLMLVALITIVGSVAARGAGGLLTIAWVHAFSALCVTLPFSLVAFRRIMGPPSPDASTGTSVSPFPELKSSRR